MQALELLDSCFHTRERCLRRIAITFITPALPLTKKSQIALHLKRARFTSLRGEKPFWTL